MLKKILAFLKLRLFTLLTVDWPCMILLLTPGHLITDLRTMARNTVKLRDGSSFPISDWMCHNRYELHYSYYTGEGSAITFVSDIVRGQRSFPAVKQEVYILDGSVFTSYFNEQYSALAEKCQIYQIHIDGVWVSTRVRYWVPSDKLVSLDSFFLSMSIVDSSDSSVS